MPTDGIKYLIMYPISDSMSKIGTRVGMILTKTGHRIGSDLSGEDISSSVIIRIIPYS